MRTAPTDSASRSLFSTERSPQAGFTLVEVGFVVLILGVLLSFGIPTYLGAHTRASDLQASANLRTALTAGITTSDLRSDFRLASDRQLAAYEPSLTYVDELTPSTGPKIVSVDASASDRWVAVVRSESGTCFAAVAGPFGQIRIEVARCAAGDVGLPPPTFVRRSVAHEGALTAVTAGMCLEVDTDGFLEQQPCTGDQPRLTVATRSDGFSTLSLGDGLCFGTTGPVRSARVIDEVCAESDDQLWTIIASFNDTVQFKNKETGYCLDVYGASANAGADLIQWGYGDPPDGTCKPTTSANNHNFGFG